LNFFEIDISGRSEFRVKNAANTYFGKCLFS